MLHSIIFVCITIPCNNLAVVNVWYRQVWVITYWCHVAGEIRESDGSETSSLPPTRNLLLPQGHAQVRKQILFVTLSDTAGMFSICCFFFLVYFLLIYLSIHLSVYASVSLSIHLLISIYIFIYLLICLFFQRSCILCKNL